MEIVFPVTVPMVQATDFRSVKNQSNVRQMFLTFRIK